MSSSIFLTLDQVLAIHADQIRRYGGSPDLLDRNLLDAAIALPQQGFGDQLFHPDTASQAAAYLYHLVKTMPLQMATNESELPLRSYSC